MQLCQYLSKYFILLISCNIGKKKSKKTTNKNSGYPNDNKITLPFKTFISLPPQKKQTVFQIMTAKYSNLNIKTNKRSMDLLLFLFSAITSWIPVSIQDTTNCIYIMIILVSEKAPNINLNFIVFSSKIG